MFSFLFMAGFVTTGTGNTGFAAFVLLNLRRRRTRRRRFEFGFRSRTFSTVLSASFPSALSFDWLVLCFGKRLVSQNSTAGFLSLLLSVFFSLDSVLGSLSFIITMATRGRDAIFNLAFRNPSLAGLALSMVAAVSAVGSGVLGGFVSLGPVDQPGLVQNGSTPCVSAQGPGADSCLLVEGRPVAALVPVPTASLGAVVKHRAVVGVRVVALHLVGAPEVGVGVVHGRELAVDDALVGHAEHASAAVFFQGPAADELVLVEGCSWLALVSVGFACGGVWEREQRGR